MRTTAVANQSARILALEKETRSELWRQTVEAIENYAERDDLPLAIETDAQKIRAELKAYDFASPRTPAEVLEFALEFLPRNQIHASSRRFFGFFDSSPSTMGVIAETLAAAFNPQVGVWSTSPGAVEIEQHLICAFGEKFGYERSLVDGTFTSGGAEANHTALLAALTKTFPDFGEKGLRSLDKQPAIYISAEGHHSVLKAVRSSGIGAKFVRSVRVKSDLKMDVDDLCAKIAEDKNSGLRPFLIVGTAGTTAAGTIDPLDQIADVATRENLWFHADAAWGGAAMIVPEMRHLFAGIERADSITFDPHKWLSVPRGIGMFLTRHARVLSDTFHVEPSYVPASNSAASDVIDPFTHSIQWTRRFIGLKLFLTLAACGWEGYAEIIRHQVEVANYLRQELEKSGW